MVKLTEWDVLVNGRKGDSTREIWDFPDPINSSTYESITYAGKSYSVCKHKGRTSSEMTEIAKILAEYQKNNDKIMAKIAARKKKDYSEKENKQLELVLKHHGKNSKKIAELNPKNGGFAGMNKPYEITLEDSSTTFPIGPNVDKCTGVIERSDTVCKLIGGLVPYLRPSYRIIYINVNSLRRYDHRLLVHELAHTAANHVMYRPSDHGADFNSAEALLKKFS